MIPKILLRVAAFVMLLHTIGHAFGHLTWKQASDSTKQEVINKMTQKQFPFMGSVRSMGDYYNGYGFASTIALLFVVFLLWIVSEQAIKIRTYYRKLLFV